MQRPLAIAVARNNTAIYRWHTPCSGLLDEIDIRRLDYRERDVRLVWRAKPFYCAATIKTAQSAAQPWRVSLAEQGVQLGGAGEVVSGQSAGIVG